MLIILFVIYFILKQVLHNLHQNHDMMQEMTGLYLFSDIPTFVLCNLTFKWF